MDIQKRPNTDNHGTYVKDDLRCIHTKFKNRMASSLDHLLHKPITENLPVSKLDNMEDISKFTRMRLRRSFSQLSLPT